MGRWGEERIALITNGKSLSPVGPNSEVAHPSKNMNEPMVSALFTNWTQEPFTGWWGGKSRTYLPGEAKWLPDSLAQHFAKHLTNRELLRTDSKGNLVYPNGDKMTSPKRPADVPMFMELFNKAYSPSEQAEDFGDPEKDSLDALIESANRNRGEPTRTPTHTSRPPLPDVEENPRRGVDHDAQQEAKLSAKASSQDPTQPQVIVPPDFNDSDEESFEGKPKG